VAGALKLTIPFFTVAAGTAAFYIFKSRNAAAMPLPDDVYLTLMNAVVTPQYWGLKGLILAGLISAIFASIYSMMNSVSTMISVDIYHKFIKSNASDLDLVVFGKKSIVVLSIIALVAAYFTFDPSSKDNIFLTMSAWTSYLKPGIVAAFIVGILWKKVHPKTAVITMLAAPIFGLSVEFLYKMAVQNDPNPVFGASLNFMHRVFLTFIFCVILQVILSKKWPLETEVAADLTIDGQAILRKLGVFFAAQLPFLLLAFSGFTPPQYLATPAALMALAQFIFEWNKRKHIKEHRYLLQSDLFYAGLLAGITVFILYFFA
jgi:solute:Na+ symporter, SSS family